MCDSKEARKQPLGSLGKTGLGLGTVGGRGHAEDQLEPLPAQSLTDALFIQTRKS